MHAQAKHWFKSLQLLLLFKLLQYLPETSYPRYLLFDLDLDIKILVGTTFDPAGFKALTSDVTQCGGVYDRIRTGTLFYIHCYQTLVGRYVVVQMDETDAQLTVCELEVYQEQGKAVYLLHLIHHQWSYFSDRTRKGLKRLM